MTGEAPTSAARRSSPREIATAIQLREKLAQRVAAVATRLDAVGGSGSPSPENLHRFHRDLRKLRTELRPFRRALTAGARERASHLDRRLARLSQVVGEVRDFDVRLSLLKATPLRGVPDEARDEVQEAEARLREDARTGRELLRAYARTEMESGLVHGMSELVAPGAELRHLARASRAIDRALSRSSERAERALVRSRRRASPGRLHSLRVAIRRARYLTDLSNAVRPEKARGFPVTLVHLQGELGRLHDLDVLSDYLEQLGTGGDWAASRDAPPRV
ncbi:MAG: CHAD domain-containing protein, partial [Thermoplasmata archaeon]|nr:CHAD domain-containing protein [Thermoplasmata archaeon]